MDENSAVEFALALFLFKIPSFPDINSSTCLFLPNLSPSLRLKQIDFKKPVSDLLDRYFIKNGEHARTKCIEQIALHILPVRLNNMLNLFMNCSENNQFMT